MQVSRLISGRVENSQSMTGKSSHGWDIPGLRGHGGGGRIGESSGSAVTLGTRAGMWVPGRRGPPEKSGALRAQCPAVHTSRGPSLYQAVEQEGRLVSLGRTPPISACLPTFLTMLFMWPNPDTCLPQDTECGTACVWSLGEERRRLPTRAHPPPLACLADSAARRMEGVHGGGRC